MKTPRSKLRGIKRKIPLNLLEASFGESHPKRLNEEHLFRRTGEPLGCWRRDSVV
jgi:hypothetical protein